MGLQVTGNFDGWMFLAFNNFGSSLVVQEKVNTSAVLQLDQADRKFG